MPKQEDLPLRHRELIRALKKFGVMEKIKKGSRRMLFHSNVNGRPAFVPIHAHSENHEHSRKVVRSVRERFAISFKDFYEAL